MENVELPQLMQAILGRLTVIEEQMSSTASTDSQHATPPTTTHLGPRPSNKHLTRYKETFSGKVEENATLFIQDVEDFANALHINH
ncbi:hypothetical protein CHUAL_009700 [Chamberlinius hualienensis]